MPDARIGELVDSVKWYFKIPGTGARVTSEHVQKLLKDLPSIMTMMQRAVANDAATLSSVRRLPAPYVDAFQRIN
jgi:hypothetical protein